MIDKLKEWLYNFFGEHEDMYMAGIAVIIGVAAGYGNVVFRYLIVVVQEFFYGTKEEFLLDTLTHVPIYKIVLIPALGGLIVGLLGLVFKSAKGHGVPDVIKAIALNVKISPFVAVVKSFTSAITLGTGGSAGREGPIIQIGSALGSGVGKVFKFSTTRMKTAVACGAAGGLAATFNAPIGGAMFAAEILLGEFGIRTFSPIIISSVIATVVSRGYLGNAVTFAAPAYHLRHYMELPLYMVLGFVCAIIGVFFIRFFYKTEETFENLKIPSFAKPALGGLLLGVLSIYSREIMGVGYDTIHQILASNQFGLMLLLLVFLKILATSLTLGSGGSGGLFVPALFIGSATGGALGWIFNIAFPGITASSGAYALVAMSAMLGATIRAPLTAILIIFEITQSYEIILPLMFATIIANVAANWMEKESIFSWILAKEGIRIKRGTEERVLSEIKVEDVMLKNIVTFKETSNFEEITEGIKQADHIYYPVLNENGYLSGIMSLDNIKNVMFEKGLEEIVVAGEICTKEDLIYVYPEDSLATALKKLGIKDLGALPVVEKINGNLKVKGLLRRSDIILAYNKALATTSV